MLDQNGKYELLSLNDAKTLSLEKATAAGVEVPSGSVEDQLNTWLAQELVQLDTAMYALYVKQFSPDGTDIDLQNLGNPRLVSKKSQGFLKLVNGTGSPILVAINSTFTAPNGNVYSCGNKTVTVAAAGEAFISVSSSLSGKSQNLPSGQTFTNSLSLTATNPQPFTNGGDDETDAEYLERLIFLKTNNASEQSTPSAIKELKTFYDKVRIYVNNSPADYITPVPVPTGGYVGVVNFPSGINAGPEEIENALQIFLNRFEFGNVLFSSSNLHPLLSDTIYIDDFPQNLTVAPAQSVKTTIACEIEVSFLTGMEETEKNILATGFAKQFVQNLISFYGGAAGNSVCTFQSAAAGPPAPVISNLSVSSKIGRNNIIAPIISIEQIRAFISDENFTANTQGLSYLKCTLLTAEFDPEIIGETKKKLSIHAPTGGTIESINFFKDNLFTDNTSWYDRFIFLDPSLITVKVSEV